MEVRVEVRKVGEGEGGRYRIISLAASWGNK